MMDRCAMWVRWPRALIQAGERYLIQPACWSTTAPWWTAFMKAWMRRSTDPARWFIPERWPEICTRAKAAGLTRIPESSARANSPKGFWRGKDRSFSPAELCCGKEPFPRTFWRARALSTARIKSCCGKGLFPPDCFMEMAGNTPPAEHCDMRDNFGGESIMDMGFSITPSWAFAAWKAPLSMAG